MSNEAKFLDAARDGDAATVTSLLDQEPGLVNVAGGYDKTALHWAAEKDNTEIAEILLGAGADIDARTSWGATPFEWAAVMGSSRVADLLLERGTGGLSLVTAAGLGKLDEVKRLSETEEDKISDALHLAARNGRRETVEYLLERGGDIDARGFFGATGLHWAAINGHQDTVEFLIDHGADLSLKDDEFDSTPEGWALEGGHNTIAAMLRAGA